MQYLSMNKQRSGSVNVPTLDGGVNYTDMPYEVADNQLTECKNMWWHNGALRTRPGMGAYFRAGSDSTGSMTMEYNGFHRISEREVVLSSIYEGEEDGSRYFYAATIKNDSDAQFLGSDSGDFHKFQFDSESFSKIYGVDVEDIQVKIFRHGLRYYAFFNMGYILSIAGSYDEEEPNLNGEIRWVWRREEAYAPLIMLNGKGNMDESGAPATNFEGFNRLTGAFRCQYTTDGESFEFQLPVTDLTFFRTEKRIEVIHISLLLQHHKDEGDTETVGFFIEPPVKGDIATGAVSIDPDLLGIKYDDLGNEDVDGCELKCTVNYKKGLLQFHAVVYRHLGSVDYINPLPIPRVCANNLEIRAWKTDKETVNTTFAMAQSVWFGGDRSGVHGGTRLFMADSQEVPALVCWSDVDNPLYFPENNCANVGTTSESVTGFGKQADKLILFKESEIYSAQYAAGGGYTVDDLTSGRVIDVTAVSATFPITPVHSTIGCDCPKTIQLVNNQLVWLCSTGHVYTLTANNQYSEDNVRDVSLLIRRELQKHTADELKAAIAGEYMGYYVLIVGKRIYMMNAEHGAFASVNYYSSKERAQRAIPWYVWELEDEFEWEPLGIITDGEVLKIECVGKTVCFEGEKDYLTNEKGTLIPCSFSTKAFNFGFMDRRKSITQLYIGAAAASPLKIRLSYITDRFTAEDAAILEGVGDPENMTAENHKVYRVTPNVHRVGLFGLRVDCDGAMAVTGITVKYKNEGVTR